MEPTRKQSLGLFHMLPYEIRELIWLELIPAGKEAKPRKCTRKYGRLTKRGRMTHLGILCTNRGIYNEVSKLLYEYTSLIISMESIDYSSDRLISVSFEQIIHPLRRKRAFRYERTLWNQMDEEHMESSGFCSLPFHKFSGVIICLHPPHRLMRKELFLRWKEVNQLISIVTRTTIDSLTIRLQKDSFHDWFDDWQRPKKSSLYQVINSRHDCDVVCMPFFALRNLKDIRVEAQSSKLVREIDWKVINKGMETVHNQAWGYCESPIHKDYGIFGHDVDRAVAGDYFWLHLDMWKMNGSSDFQRDFLSQWFDRNGNSEFETQVKRIVDRYPEIIETYDPDMIILEEMHMKLVVLYSYAKSLRGDEDLSSWDQELWKTAFPDGITSYDKKLVLSRSKRPDLTYLKITKKYAYLSTMTDIIIDWRQQKAKKPFWRHPSCEEYGVRRSYWS